MPFSEKMQRKYDRKRENMFSAENMKLAVQDVLETGLSLRKAAKRHNVKKSSVANFVVKAAKDGFENCKLGPQYTTRQVLLTDIKKSLEKAHEGWLMNRRLELNYQIPRHGENKAWLAVIGIRDTWKDNPDYHSELPIVSHNNFNNKSSTPTAGIICASGRALPPVWIFSRRRYDAARMTLEVDVESGALGLVYPSGWMTFENFLNVFQHFVKHVRCIVDMIMDSHQSHLSVEGIVYAKENGIVILTLPPHTSNKLEPRNRTIFRPFKRFF